MNVLIVDDSRIMRNIIKNTLAQTNVGFAEIMEACNGVEAWELLGKVKVDLMLLDWNMPQLNGLDLIKKIRNDAKYTSMPVIMITSEAAKYNVIEAVKAGVSDYLIKPINEKSLMEKLKRVLEIA